MYKEAILEFIIRKDAALMGEYIRDFTPEELWPYDEEQSEETAHKLNLSDDVNFCPWCMVTGWNCEKCVYGKVFGSCLGHDGGNYTEIQQEVTGGLSVVDYLEEEGFTEYIMEPIKEVLKGKE